MFFRLCCRAPRTTSRFMGRRELARTGLGWAPHVRRPPRLSLPPARGGLTRSGYVRARIPSLLIAAAAAASIGAASFALWHTPIRPPADRTVPIASVAPPPEPEAPADAGPPPPPAACPPDMALVEGDFCPSL